MLFKNKRGQLAQSIVIWFFSVFLYFVMGYDIFKSILLDVFIPQNPTGIMYFLGVVAPFVPILGLMFWGYYILDEIGVVG